MAGCLHCGAPSSGGYCSVDARAPTRPGDAQGRTACAALDQRDFEGQRLPVNGAKPQAQSSGLSHGGGRQRREARW
jgi:hypothetical protein